MAFSAQRVARSAACAVLMQLGGARARAAVQPDRRVHRDAATAELRDVDLLRAGGDEGVEAVDAHRAEGAVSDQAREDAVGERCECE